MSFWQTMKTKLGGKHVLTAEQMGTALAAVAIHDARSLMEEFTEKGVTDHLSMEQCARLGFESLTFAVVCKTISVVLTYGEKGYNVRPFLARAAMKLFAENLHIDDVPGFVKAGLEMVESHYRHYGKDILDILVATNKEEFRNKTGPLGVKIFRKILHPVIGISPVVQLEKKEDLDALIKKEGLDALIKEAEERYKELEQFPNKFMILLLLPEICCVHAIVHSSVNQATTQEFTLGDE